MQNHASTLAAEFKLDAARVAATVALIGSAGVSILVTAFWGSDAVIGAIDFARTNGLMIALFVLSVVLLRKTKIGAVPVMVLAGVLKLCLALIGIG